MNEMQKYSGCESVGMHCKQVNHIHKIILEDVAVRADYPYLFQYYKGLQVMF